MSFTQVITISIHALLIQNICFWQHVKIFIVFFPDDASRSRAKVPFALLLCCLCVSQYSHVERIWLQWHNIPTHFFPEEGDYYLFTVKNKTKHVNAPLQMDGSWSKYIHIIMLLTLQVADTMVGWALGYMLSLSNLLPAEQLELRKALTPGVWGSLIFLFVMLLAAVLSFCLFRVYNGQNKKRGSESTI